MTDLTQKQKYNLEEIIIHLNKFKNVKQLTNDQLQWVRYIHELTHTLLESIRTNNTTAF